MRFKDRINNTNEQIIKAKEEETDLVVKMFLVFLCIGAILTCIFCLAHQHGEKFMVQKLCSVQQYDFCEVKHISYELRGEK